MPRHSTNWATVPDNVWVFGISVFLTIPERRALADTCRRLSELKREIVKSHLDPRKPSFTLTPKVTHQLMWNIDKSNYKAIDRVLWQSNWNLDNFGLYNIVRNTSICHFRFEHATIAQFIEAGLVATPSLLTDLDYSHKLILFDAFADTDPCFLDSSVCVEWFKHLLVDFFAQSIHMDCLWWAQNWLKADSRSALKDALYELTNMLDERYAEDDHYQWVSRELKETVCEADAAHDL